MRISELLSLVLCTIMPSARALLQHLFYFTCADGIRSELEPVDVLESPPVTTRVSASVNGGKDQGKCSCNNRILA